MKDFAKKFYASYNWTRIRKAYTSYRRGLCERCLKEGMYNVGVIVHHKIHLTEQNIKNPEITSSFKNLELLCFNCHNKEHQEDMKRGLDTKYVNKQKKEVKKRQYIPKPTKRYYVDEKGEVVVIRDEE